MTEQQTPVLDPGTQSAPAAPAPAKKKHKKKKAGKILVAAAVLAALAVGGFLMWKFVLSDPEEEQGEVLTDMVYYGSISSMVEGSGVAKAKSASTITLAANGTVNEVFVTEGQQVQAGDPLYTIRSESAEQAVTSARENLASLNEDMQKLREDLSELTVRAPFAGKLMNAGEFYPDDNIAAGTKIATLVNDRKLKLSLYFSYAYESSISVGQSVQVSVPAVMGSFSGKVEKINKVSFITPEGSKCFEVVFVMDNPGTLTQDMDASVTFSAADGTPIYPYADGQLKYYEVRDISTKAGGPLVRADLLNYADVSSGQVLMVLGDDDVQEQIKAKNEQIQEAQQKLEDAQKALSDFNAVAPISGTVTSCGLVAGEDVESGRVAVSIADTTVMNVTIDVDERNVGNIQTGMTIDLTDWDGNMFMGIVDGVSLEPKTDSGVTTYPVSVRVDNPDGAMRNGQTVNYSFAASQSLNCLVVPVICVHYVSDADGNNLSVVYLKADSAPENMVELPEEIAKEIPEGFYPVEVEVGLSDTSNAEIRSGLNEGDEVFTNIIKEQANNYGW